MIKPASRPWTLQSLESLRLFASDRENQVEYDLGFVVADGLSAVAIHQNAPALLGATLPLLQFDKRHHWSIAPIVLVKQGRVAVGDEVGQVIGAKIVVVLIGERPGLSSPDSMGLYITWAPKVGLNDANKNCVSNVRAMGLPVQEAAEKLCYLLGRSRALELTGIKLKDESSAPKELEPQSFGQISSDNIWKS